MSGPFLLPGQTASALSLTSHSEQSSWTLLSTFLPGAPPPPQHLAPLLSLCRR